MPAIGGTPRRLAPQFLDASHPAWARDSSRILFHARKERSQQSVDWWVTTPDGAEPAGVGVRPLLREARLNAFVTFPEIWTGDWVVFSGAVRDNIHLWKLRIGASGRPSGKVEQITSGTGREQHPSAASDGTLVVASTQFASDVWMLPVDAARGKVTGEMKRLTEDPAEDDSVAISADGVRLVFNSKRDGRTGLWLRDMNTGKLCKLSPGATHSQWPQITADGRFAGFGKLPTKATPPFGYGIVGVDDGSLREVDTPSSVGPWGLSPLGDYIVAAGASDGPLQATRLETGENKVFLEHKEWQLLSPHFSPDERWIALHTRPSETARQLFIVVRDPDVPGRT